MTLRISGEASGFGLSRTTRHHPTSRRRGNFTEGKGRDVAWIYLSIAGLFECGWAIGLKYTEGFTKLWPTVFTVLAMIVSFQLLSLSMKSIPVGTAYAVWTGIGAVGVALLGMTLFGESRDVMRIVCILLIVSGVIGLKVFSGDGAS
jgi:quaternary ammonium compound-resistance protein SugE